MKHREKPDLRTEMSPIGGDGPQRLGGRVEQDLVDRAGVLEGNRGDLVGNGEDDMEILRVEKLRPPSLDPFRPGERLALGAAARTAAVVSDPLFATAVALFDMASERRRSAALDGQSLRRVVRSIAKPGAALARQHRSDGIYPPPPDLTGP